MAPVSVPGLTRVLALWGPVLLYMAAIFWASAQPDVALPSNVGDKPSHLVAFAILAVLLVRALAGGLPSRITVSTALVAAALTTAYGASDELHQMFVPGRVADVRDLVADALGGAAGAFACWVWGIISPAPRGHQGPPRHGL